MVSTSVLDQLDHYVRRTPVIPVDHPDVDLWVKAEYVNLFGSSKDRSALWILRGALERGDIAPGGVVVESSSGNFAMAMAGLCRRLGIAFVPVVDPNVNATTSAFLDVACERVERVAPPEGPTAYLEARLARVGQIRREVGGVFWPNQYANIDAAVGHYELTGLELVQDLPHLDFVFIGAGTGGTLAGVSQRVKERWPSTNIVAVDVHGSTIFGGPAAPRHIPGLGASRRSSLYDDAIIDDVVIVTEPDTIRACHDLVRSHGLHVGGSTGSVKHAIDTYFASPRGIGSGRARPRVAFLAADRGTAYSSTVYNPEWVRHHFGDLFETDSLTAA